MIAPFIIAAALVQPPAPAPSAAPAATAPPAPIVQWDSAGFTPPTPSPDTTPVTDPAATVIERLLRAGGLLGGASKGGSGSTAWLADSGKLSVFKTDAQQQVKFAELPANWLALDEGRKESAYLAVTLNANALRTSAEPLFDSPWLQRIIDRLAFNNARLVSLRATVLPPPADNLPPILELKAVASARSEKPGTPLVPITLIAPGWGGTRDEVAAITGASWAASIRADSGGLGQIGRDGGVGTWAGLIRLAVDMIGTAQNADTAAWAKAYTTWQDRSSDGFRSLSTRLQPRGTLACYGSAGAPDLVLVIQARPGERVDTLTKAMDQLAGPCSLASGKGVWTVTATGPLTPRLAVTVASTPTAAYLIVSLEHDADHALLQQTAARLRAVK